MAWDVGAALPSTFRRKLESVDHMGLYHLVKTLFEQALGFIHR